MGIIRLLHTNRRWTYLHFFKWKLLDIFYEIIRFLFVKNIDINEDFNCGMCNKPVLRRYLFCSIKCEKNFDKSYIRVPREGEGHFAVIKNDKARK